MVVDEFASSQCVIEGKLYWCPLRSTPAQALRSSPTAAKGISYCVDEVLLYEPFFADFGPLNLGKAYRFCRQTHQLLIEGERTRKRVFFFCSPHVHHKSNAAVLIGLYQVLLLGRSADEVCDAIAAFKPFAPFRDASCGAPTFHLTVFHCIKGAQKARDVGLLDWGSSQSQWSNEEYEHYEQVENGDLNWIVPGKLLAFSGPAARGNEIPGYRLHTPEDYWDYFRKKGVTGIVRLNKKVYDRKRFTDAGFNHYDLYFPDGSCPRETILLHFLDIVEGEPGAVAVHCKAGLGRTGLLICCYMMKHFKFTAEEVIGYIRLCRPGSVIGPQQNFLCDIQAMLWAEGDLWRSARGISKPHLVLQDVLEGAGRVNAPSFHPQPPSYPPPACAPQYHYTHGMHPVASAPPNLAAMHAGASPPPFKSHPAPSPLSSISHAPPPRGSKPSSAATSGWGMSPISYSSQPNPTHVNSNGSIMAAPPPQQQLSPQPPPAPNAVPNNQPINNGWGISGCGIGGGSAGMPVHAMHRPTAPPAPADMSLAQHSTHIRRAYNGLTVQVPQSPSSNPSSNNSTPNSAKFGPATAPPNTPAQARALITPRYATAAAPRSPTPQRFSSASTHKPSSACTQPSPPAAASSPLTPPTHSYSEVAASHVPSTPPPAMRGNGVSILGARSNSNMLARPSPPPASSAPKRSPSADVSAARANDLRSTLHTDTLRAASRPRQLLPERTAMSAELSMSRRDSSSGPGEAGYEANTGNHTPTSPAHPMEADRPSWQQQRKLGGAAPPSLANGSTPSSTQSNPVATTPKAAGPAARSMHARTLAPNGQPRKVPIPLLSQIHAGMVNQSTASHKAARLISGPSNDSSNARARPSLELKSGSRGGGMGGLATPDQARRANAAAQMRFGLASK